VPTHRDMPEGFHDAAHRRSAEVTEAVERARAARAATAVNSRDQLARERRARLESEDAARTATSRPPPGVAADLAEISAKAAELGIDSDASDFDVGWRTDDLLG
jgi:phosphoglycolate phosphatase-like HAD superfamily hydrolase